MEQIPQPAVSPRTSVWWLTEHYFPGRGGMAQSCDRIVYGLRSSGVTVDVLHLAHRAEHFSVTERAGGRDVVCPIGGDPPHALNWLWAVLAADPNRHEVTHVVAFGGVLPLLAGPLYAAWLGRPLITLLRGNDFDVGLFIAGRREVLQEALVRAARVCVVSREKADRIAAYWPAVTTSWVPNGIDLADWAPLPSHHQRAATWRQTAVATGRRVLGLFGQIKPKKGALLFLEQLAASGLADRFHLLLVGEIDDELTRWLTTPPVPLAVTTHPFVDRYELLSHYAACDLLVVPSLYDGLPNVVLEAAGLGLPLLASTAGGMGDVLIDERHGLLFAPGDGRGCRWAIERAATVSDEQLREMGRAARRMVETQLNHRLEIERYLAVLAETAPVHP